MQHNKLLSTHNRGQFIEGLCDGDFVEDLLQESGLILSTTVMKCRFLSWKN